MSCQLHGNLNSGMWQIVAQVKNMAWSLNLAAMGDLTCGVKSQTLEILHLSGVSEAVFITKPNSSKGKRIEERKCWPFDNCDSEILKLVNRFKMADSQIQLREPQLRLSAFSLTEISMLKIL